MTNKHIKEGEWGVWYIDDQTDDWNYLINIFYKELKAVLYDLENFPLKYDVYEVHSDVKRNKLFKKLMKDKL